VIALSVLLGTWGLTLAWGKERFPLDNVWTVTVIGNGVPPPCPPYPLAGMAHWKATEMINAKHVTREGH
jgi:hypothetical protein